MLAMAEQAPGLQVILEHAKNVGAYTVHVPPLGELSTAPVMQLYTQGTDEQPIFVLHFNQIPDYNDGVRRVLVKELFTRLAEVNPAIKVQYSSGRNRGEKVEYLSEPSQSTVLLDASLFRVLDRRVLTRPQQN